MDVLIVSGFLGAGKTTFIKELIRKSCIAPVVMENEYGNNSIDARDLKQTQQELQILEFMEGCVCCTMKDSFVNSVLAVSATLDPEYLIIEPTGVGRLSSILDNLKPILYDKIRLLPPVVVVSPCTFQQNMHEWPQLYRDQVASAGTVVFSKCEHEEPGILSSTAGWIRQINPSAQIVREHYSTRPESWWKQLLVYTQGGGKKTPAQTMSTAPEICRLTLNNACIDNPVHLVMFLEDCLRGEFGSIVRAKGTLSAGGQMLRFDMADNMYCISGSPDDKAQCVFIGKTLEREKICKRLGTSPLDEALFQNTESGRLNRIPGFRTTVQSSKPFSSR